MPFTDVHAASAAASISRVITLARTYTGMEVSWLSEFTGDVERIAAVDIGDPATAPQVGHEDKLEGSFGTRILDGRLPMYCGDTESVPRPLAMALAGDIRAYVAVPILSPNGQPIGMLACTSSNPTNGLGDTEFGILRILAQLLAELSEQANTGIDASARETIRTRVQRVISGDGLRAALQPIIEINTGAMIGAESLARFDEPPTRPDLWFAEATSVGLGVDLEVQAARTGIKRLSDLPPTTFLAINVSPAAMLSDGLAKLLSQSNLHSLMLEVTEHAPVDDYQMLAAKLAPWRAAGLRLAVDDAGAGYASFRHILQLQPDVIKVDISLVRDIHLDPARQTLVAALAGLAEATGAFLLAEGVETQDELNMLSQIGVRYAQGYLLGRPADELPSGEYPRPTPQPWTSLDNSDRAAEIARAVAEAHNLESLARPLLDVVLAATGLQTSYLTQLDEKSDALHHNFVQTNSRTQGALYVPEGLVVSWAESLGAQVIRSDLVWTNNVAADLFGQESTATAPIAMQTFLAVPIRTADGIVRGTLCAGSTDSVYLSPTALAHVRLCAHLIAVSPQLLNTVSLAS